MLRYTLLSLLAAPAALASVLPHSPGLAARQASTSSDKATAPATNAPVAVQANLDVLNALPFPSGRIGANNATIFNISLPAEASFDYSGDSSVEAAQDELSQLQNATVVDYQDGAFSEVAGSIIVERVFNGSNFHEAPVYLPTLKAIFLTPDEGSMQYLIDLNTLTLHNFTAYPPVENINGGTYHNGTLYVTTNGGNETNPAIFAINPATKESSIVVDNYFGLRFNSLNDIVADSQGNLWFNDPTYGSLNGMNPNPPQLLPATYLYNATTKVTKAVVDGLKEPNGLAFSPDQSVLYVSDTGSSQSSSEPPLAGPRDIYAFDILNGSFAANRRLFHRNPSGIPDGVKVDSAGRVWSVFGDADTGALEVISPDGQLLGLVQFPDLNDGSSVQTTNLVFVPPAEGETNDTLWVVGGTAVWKISGLQVTGVRIK
ncbi:hypothetical protein JCM10207_004416 [Rhodosporidiobolus poonsookiae]